MTETSSSGVGAGLAQYHRDRSDKARKRLLETLRQIEAEVAERGYYCDAEDPDKHLRLSMVEVQRRAGLSDAYLRNRRDHDLREIVQDWLHVQKQNFATSKPSGKKIKRDTIRFYEDVLRKTSSEAQAWLIKKVELEKELSALRQEIESVRRSDNVAGIKSKRKQ